CLRDGEFYLRGAEPVEGGVERRCLEYFSAEPKVPGDEKQDNNPAKKDERLRAFSTFRSGGQWNISRRFFLWKGHSVRLALAKVQELQQELIAVDIGQQ